MKKTVDFLNDHSAREKDWQELWEKEGVCKFDRSSTKPLFTIDVPPPTISGKLHLGHVFSYTQADIIARYKRLMGLNVFNPFCIDNNGLPTERLMIKTEGFDPQTLGLETFYQKVFAKIGEYEKLYEDLFKTLGFCYDYSLKYTSISPTTQKLTQMTFIDLLSKGIIYRQDAPALYCPECQTAVAQAEVEDREIEGIFYNIQFTDSTGKPLIISTTRPEFIPACVGACINPKDERYKYLIGQEITTPLGMKVKVIADDKADPQKGTGIVMVCSYGDETDLYWIRNYSLKERIIIDHEGKLINTGVEGMDGTTITEGRDTIVKWLEGKGLITGQKLITHEVGTHERCHTPIEIIPVKQWFAKTLTYKHQILELAKKVKFYPKYFEKRFAHWVENLKWDWCISRERYFGIPIPVFYCNNCGEMFAANAEELPIDPRFSYQDRKCPKCQGTDIKPETNVLDTWFTASQTPDINGYWPMSMRTQAHDNIRVWSFYSMVMGVIKHDNAVPWHELMTAGHLLVKKGEKISKKTGGGAYDPNKLTEEHGVDAIRYAMCQAKLGTDAYFEEENVARGKKLITKLINAYRLVVMNLDANTLYQLGRIDLLDLTDRWILNKFTDTAWKIKESANKYEPALTLLILEDFFWKYFCDNYLEIAKYRLKGDDGSKMSTQKTLSYLILELLKLFSIYLPYTTEELFHSTLENGELITDSEAGFFQSLLSKNSIHSLTLTVLSISYDKELDEAGELLIEKLTEIRKAKATSGKKLSEEVDSISIFDTEENISKIRQFENELKGLGHSKEMNFQTDTISKVLVL